MAVFNEPTKWAQTLGKDADVTTIPDTAGETDPSIDKIFPSVFSIPLARGGRAIPRSVLNGLFKLLGDWVYYIQNGGLPTYSSDFDYVAGRVVLYNGNLYKCIQANGASSTVVAPDSVSPLGSDYWVKVATLADFANFANIDLSNVTAPVQAFKNMSIEWGIPDYTAGTQLTQGVNYTADVDSFIFIGVQASLKNVDYPVSIAINGINIYSGVLFDNAGASGSGRVITVYVKKGDIFNMQTTGTVATYTKFPLLGAN